MTIAIIGNGNIGSGLAGALSKAGHDVAAYDKDADLAQAVKGADIVILATPFGAAEDIAKAADFAGKIVVDVSNPMTADMSGLSVGLTTSAAEDIAALLPGATLVKAFNTVFAGHYGGDLTLNGAPIQTFVASDDDAAKDTITKLAASIGLEPINAGPLKNARYLEPLGFLNIQFGFVLGLGGNIAPKWQIT
ncbi:NADPH-dependent F420 reductase [Tropicibacter naphthalenivorans]|uniref:NADPH-dependent F420 reductase n=1 Tax=Tropicibacter naphthalenivorans TaxID=441103 RepID=A0A0P1GKS9_9RHOB|nr:NAD(P)-binding domain-containing protein [Tropicibacter naphthalenivorans]CUH82594.1 NADPH-dependent F420 reductase [Tropicibacter naphthalenivorans]SMD09519.1 hypothetical protein SAMN04488093_11927 [Tropicibacter naphthalenivorans]